MRRILRLLSMLLFTIMAVNLLDGGTICRALANSSPDDLGPQAPSGPPIAHDESLAEAADARMRWALIGAAVAIEEFYDSNDASYTGATVRILRDFGFRSQPAVTVKILDATGRHYKLEASAAGGSPKSWVFDSSDAKVKPAAR
jgi:hypothetical protein